MKIHYCAHACFVTEDNRGFRVLIDPFPEDLGYKPLREKSDMVLVSHDHHDHCGLDGILGQSLIVRGCVKRSLGGVEAQGFLCPHAGQSGGFCVAFYWEQDGVSFCHLGDCSADFSLDFVAKAKNCDVLFLPVGGGHALGPQDAMNVISRLEPSTVIPMHYRTPYFRRELND